MLRAAAAVAVCLIAAACNNPSAPSPPPPPPPPPPTNTPPRAAIVSPVPARVEAGEFIELAADVEDAETALDQLTYVWTAGAVGGAFARLNDNPRRVRWEAPRSAAPGAFSFALSVTERYLESGIAREQAVSATSAAVQYNDSPAEIMRIAVRFITELFSTYSVSPRDAVQDFSDSCPGKQSELEDVERNRRVVQILSGTYSNVSVTVNADRTRGRARGICVFRDIRDGRTQRLVGTCTLDAVYENWNWFLCSSSYDRISGPTRESLWFRVPGLRE